MNLNYLSADEVLRICNPESDLEKRLFSVCADLERNLKSCKEQLSDAEDDMRNWSCDTCSDTDRQIERAISMIESGKYEEAVKVLNAI